VHLVGFILRIHHNNIETPNRTAVKWERLSWVLTEGGAFIEI